MFGNLDVLQPGRSLSESLVNGRFVTGHFVPGRFVGVPQCRLYGPFLHGTNHSYS
jgi:hypothetical protein